MKKTALTNGSNSLELLVKSDDDHLRRKINPTTISNLSLEDQHLFSNYGIAPNITPMFQNVLNAFEHWVSKTPNNVAVTFNNQSITYKELDNESTILALILKQKGITSGDTVGVFLHRSIDLITSIIACLKLGAVYVPQDPRIVPFKMLKKISDLSSLKLILSVSDYQDRTSFFPLKKNVFLDKELKKKIYRNLYGNIKLINTRNNSSNQTCFILFTSGTTGTPNGVKVSHKNLCNILYTSPGNLGITPGTKVAQILNISFDMAAWEILGCLGNGGTLLIRNKDIEETAQKANVIIATPTILTTIDPKKCKDIESVAVAGEPCPVILANTWSKISNFYHCCGPTETTIVNTMKKCFSGSSELSIGKPTPNNTVYILNEDMSPTEIGEIGVMWAGGDCVTQGYLNNAKLNKVKYVKDPFLGGNHVMFNTGDLGKWNESGELIHYGRIDDQVKIKGFRVELDSITKIIESFEEVKRAVTLKHQNYLVTFISLHNTQVTDLLERITTSIKKELPYYYLPSEFVFLDELPKTSRGKIDKRDLKKRLIK